MVVGVTEAVPDVGRLPLQAPDAVQAVALADDQESVLAAPATMADGLAPRVTVGVGAAAAATVTVALVLPVPPAPVQASV